MEMVLITGGAGFIGSNLVEHHLSQGRQVTAFDNFSRPGGGTKKNAEYLTTKYKKNRDFKFVFGDVRNANELYKVMKGIDIVFHVAAQTAMTTSIENPVEDFKINSEGTLNVLEVIRNSDSPPILFYTSTNKVYGNLTHPPVRLVEKEQKWDFADEKFLEGVDENHPLDFEGPYGCSKGSGDAYCLDYARTFALQTVIFRMSAIYGMGQHPTEDQGWVAWFLKCALEGRPITIYGDGKQVRDILFITDLLDAFDLALEHISDTQGQVYNIGGGRDNSLSIIEMLDFLQKRLGIKPPKMRFSPWRLADQKIYISNTHKARKDLGWMPKVSKEEGITRLYNWMMRSYA